MVIDNQMKSTFFLFTTAQALKLTASSPSSEQALA
jgi:hypothetical protein